MTPDRRVDLAAAISSKLTSSLDAGDQRRRDQATRTGITDNLDQVRALGEDLTIAAGLDPVQRQTVATLALRDLRARENQHSKATRSGK
ncbi:hypothetical protein [Streptosporangium sp. NPDC002524]|uniref:hypothetical protein n=1 Tax=Streptosporangium sp. NPDC002524 TaxID=3154537 RepID=UPI003324BE8E